MKLTLIYGKPNRLSILKSLQNGHGNHAKIFRQRKIFPQKSWVARPCYPKPVPKCMNQKFSFLKCLMLSTLSMKTAEIFRLFQAKEAKLKLRELIARKYLEIFQQILHKKLVLRISEIYVHRT